MRLRVIAAVALVCAASTARGAPALDARLVRSERTLLELAPAVAAVERLLEEDDALVKLAMEQRFSDAELHFLLREYGQAAAILRDLVDEPRFLADTRLSSARYFLGEALYQERDYRSAHEALREQLLSGDGPEFELALARYLELSVRLDDFAAMDRVFEVALAGEEGRRPERRYAVAKGTFRRTDLPDEERHARALYLFSSLRGTRLEPRAFYFAGVIAVEQRRFEEARRHFEATLAALPKEEDELRDLAALALARIAHEEGEWDEAIGRYRKIPKESLHYPDALRELAFTSARKGDAEGALRAADLLLRAVAGTPLAPEARLLQARLCARTGRYAEAEKLYGEVVRELGPLRDRLQGELALLGDPAAHFEALLRSGNGEVELSKLFPEELLAYAEPDPEVERALRVVGDLGEGLNALSEARELARRVEAELADDGGLSVSPRLAEGLARANAALETVAAEKRELQAFEAGLDGRMSPTLAARIDLLRRQLEDAELRLGKARQRLGELISLRANELREAFSAEVARLELHGAALEAAANDSDGLVGKMAARSVERMATALDDMVVEADAGLSDVAWVRKQQRAEAIRRLAEEKDRAVGELDADLEGRAGAAP